MTSFLDQPDLVPARMVNEHAYCPRLCWIEWIEWVEGEFVESSDTVEGMFQHRRVDREQGDVGEPGQAGEEKKGTGGRPYVFIERHAVVV